MKKRSFLVPFLGAAGLASSAFADATPPTFPAITWPLDTTTTVASIVAFAAGAIILIAGPKIAFKAARKLIARLGNVV